jgi:hypothetical protein
MRTFMEEVADGKMGVRHNKAERVTVFEKKV